MKFRIGDLVLLNTDTTKNIAIVRIISADGVLYWFNPIFVLDNDYFVGSFDYDGEYCFSIDTIMESESYLVVSKAMKLLYT